ncbi:TetR/AcrR family transcriptional regulator [bacterium]|nr:TetR/AcrR family transcriptional regulator [bacterium]
MIDHLDNIRNRLTILNFIVLSELKWSNSQKSSTNSSIMDEKEKRIVESARDHFIHFGYKKTSLDDIIKSAQVGKGTVYKYFLNKHDLFKRVAEVEFETMFAYLQSVIIPESDPEVKMILYVNARVLFTRQYFLLRKRNRAVFEELKSAYMKTSPDNSRETAILTEILKSGEHRGLIVPGDNQQRSYLISQIVSRFEIKWCEMDREKAQEEITQLFNLLFKGLKSKHET